MTPVQFPVPSAAALRVLRHLVFFSSFSTAVGTAVLIDERRRRIKTARKAAGNARKLREAKAIHNGRGAKHWAVAAIEAGEFEINEERWSDKKGTEAASEGLTTKTSLERKRIYRKASGLLFPGTMRGLHAMRRRRDIASSSRPFHQEAEAAYSVAPHFFSSAISGMAAPNGQQGGIQPWTINSEPPIRDNSQSEETKTTVDTTEERTKPLKPPVYVERSRSLVRNLERSESVHRSASASYERFKKNDQKFMKRILDADNAGECLKRLYLYHISRYNSPDQQNDRHEAEDSSASSLDAGDAFSIAMNKLRHEDANGIAHTFLKVFTHPKPLKPFHVEVARAILDLGLESRDRDAIYKVLDKMACWEAIPHDLSNVITKCSLELAEQGEFGESVKTYFDCIRFLDQSHSLDKFSPSSVRGLVAAAKKENYEEKLTQPFLVAVVARCKQFAMHLQKTVADVASAEISRSNGAGAAKIVTRNVSTLFDIPPGQQVIDLAIQILQNASEARDKETVDRIYEWSKICGLSESLFFENTIKFLDAQRSFDDIVAHYVQRKNDFSIAANASAIIKSALVRCAPFDVAIKHVDELVAQEKSDDSDAQLAKYYGKLLDRCWSESKNYDKVKQLYDDMNDRHSGKAELMASLQSKMATLSVIAGMPDSEISLWTSAAGDKPDLNNLKTAALIAAKDGQWTSVNRILGFINESGLMPKTGAECDLLFSPILRIFRESHLAMEAISFVETAITQYRIIPNGNTRDLIIERLANEGNVVETITWIEILRKLGHSLPFDSTSLTRLLRRYSVVHRPSYEQLLMIVDNIQALRPDLLSAEAFAVVQQAACSERRKARPSRRDGLDAQFKKRQEQLGKLSEKIPNITGRSSLEDEMLLAFSSENYGGATKLYEDALDSGKAKTGNAIEIAVESSVRDHRGDQKAAIDILHKADASGLRIADASGALNMQHLNHSSHSFRKLRKMVIDHYELMDTQNAPVKHHFTVATAQHLISRGKAKYASQILEEVYLSKWSQKAPFGIVCLTVWLKAYTELSYMQGIEWVVQKVLSQNLPVTTKFMHAMSAARSHFRTKERSEKKSENAAQNVQQLEKLSQACRDRQDLQGKTTANIAQQIVNVALIAGSDEMLARDAPPTSFWESDAEDAPPMRASAAG